MVSHTVKGFGIVKKAEIDVFLELSSFFHDPADVGNLCLVPLPFLKPVEGYPTHNPSLQSFFPLRVESHTPFAKFFTVIIVANYTQQIISSCQSSHVWLWGINHSFLLSSEVLESIAVLFYLKEIPLQRAPIHHPSWRRMNWVKLPGLQTCLLKCGFLLTSSIGSSSGSGVFEIPLRVLFNQDGTVSPVWGPHAGNLITPVNTMITLCPDAGRRQCSRIPFS